MPPFHQPWSNPALNKLYNALFCDDPRAYGALAEDPALQTLFQDSPSLSALQELINDPKRESRVKILACKKWKEAGHAAIPHTLWGVVVEIGLEQGLDVLAAYRDGTARYFNQSGKLLAWESPDATAMSLIQKLFLESEKIVQAIGPWEEERRPEPSKGMARISFLVGADLYFGEAPANVLFGDALAAPALLAATELMRLLVAQVDH